MMKIFLSLTILFCCGAHMSAMEISKLRPNDLEGYCNCLDLRNHPYLKLDDLKEDSHFLLLFDDSSSILQRFDGSNFIDLKLYLSIFPLMNLELYLLVYPGNPIPDISKLINSGGDPTRIVSSGKGRFNSALWLALSSDKTVPDVTNLLLKQVNFRNNKSEYFHYKTVTRLLEGEKKSERKIELVNKMIDLGINLRIVNKDRGWNFLHYMFVGRPPYIVEIAKKFIENDVNVNLQDNEGNTPTHFIAASARGLRRFKKGKEDLEKEFSLFGTEGLKGMLELFLKNNADLSIKNNKEETAYDVAAAAGIKYGHFSCPKHIAKFFLSQHR